jgi:hypothetical protein
MARWRDVEGALARWRDAERRASMAAPHSTERIVADSELVAAREAYRSLVETRRPLRPNAQEAAVSTDR